MSESVKVHLPGESPWVTSLGVDNTGAMIGRIDNHLVATEKHGFKRGDVLSFRKVEYNFGNGPIYCWEPVGRYQSLQQVPDGHTKKKSKNGD